MILLTGLLLAGCSQPEILGTRVFDRHSRVKWIYGSPLEFYPLLPQYGVWKPQRFTDAGLFDDRLVLSCENQGGTVQPSHQHIYVIDPDTGKELFNLVFPRVAQFQWSVKRGRRLVVVADHGEARTINTYDLKTGSVTERDGGTPHLARVDDLDGVPNTLEYIGFERVSEPPGPNRPYEDIENIWVGQIEPGVRLVQEVYPGPKCYNLYLESVPEKADTSRVKLLRLVRYYPSFDGWVGYDSSGDYVIVLEDMALGVIKKTEDSVKSGSR